MTDPAGTPLDFCLEPLTPSRAVASWDELRPWVEAVRSKTDSPWRVEDVYAELKEGRATAFLAKLEGETKGLLVLVDCADRITRQRELSMWIAYSSDPKVVDLALDEVEKLARAGGFFAITGASPRKGWLRRLAPKGYNLVAYHFEKRL
jgi:hypothetical protein